MSNIPLSSEDEEYCKITSNLFIQDAYMYLDPAKLDKIGIHDLRQFTSILLHRGFQEVCRIIRDCIDEAQLHHFIAESNRRRSSTSAEEKKREKEDGEHGED